MARLLFASLLLLIASGCTITGPSEENEATDGTVAFRTEKESYWLKESTRRLGPQYTTKVAWRLDNRTPDTIVVYGCGMPTRPRLERLAGASWTTEESWFDPRDAWECFVNTPHPIEPGETLRDTLTITTPYDDGIYRGTPLKSGRYRFVVHYTVFSLPLERKPVNSEAISNTFLIAIQ